MTISTGCGARGEAPRRRSAMRTRRERHPLPAQSRAVGRGAPRGAQGDPSRRVLRRLPRRRIAVSGLRGGARTDPRGCPVRVPVAPTVRAHRAERHEGRDAGRVQAERRRAVIQVVVQGFKFNGRVNLRIVRFHFIRRGGQRRVLLGRRERAIGLLPPRRPRAHLGGDRG